MKTVSVRVVSCGPAKLGHVVVLSLTRPEVANAFNGTMVEELSAQLHTLAQDSRCRALILQGEGKHFCAGAELSWMAELGKLTPPENLAAAERMAEMFRRLAMLPFPTVAVVHGAVYGGGVGLVACCDFAIAADDSRFCLSEVKVGLLPAVILPYMECKVRMGCLRRLSLTGQQFTAAQAQAYGLIEELSPADELGARVRECVEQLLAAAPEAQRRLKTLLGVALVAGKALPSERYCRAIAEARSGSEAQAGIAAFQQKSSPPWTVTLAAEWNR